VEAAINDFVKAYNSLQATANTLTTYDKDSKTGAALVGDSTLRNLQTRIRQALTTPQAGGPTDLKVLSEIGVTFQKDGTMAVDSAKLKTAVSTNLSGVAGLFASATGSTAGYGKQISAVVDNLTSTGGALKVASDGMTASLKQLDQQFTDMKMRVDAKVERYRAQFTQLDLLMSQMSSTSTYLTQQFASMQSSSSK
jgi:flagellar hook-associated protein 2